jgi:Spy/CpxP family protein refolding chaperone
LAAGLLAVAPAAAQPGGGRGGFGGGGLTFMLRQNKQLQDELKMDKDQVEKLTAALDKVNEEMRDERGKLRDFNTPQDERTKILEKISAANNKAVASVLKEDQIKRLHQVENQQAGVDMYTKEDVQKALKLNDDQKDKIKDIVTEYRKDLRDLNPGGGRGGPGGGRGGFDPETMQKREALQKDTINSIKKQLTDEQKTALKDLTGEPFQLQFGGGPGGFGGGFGRGGQPGKVLSSGAQDQLKLTDEQKKQLEALQKEVDEKLGKILTDDQKKQLKDMQQGGGRGGRGGPGGGRGGPGKPQTDF